ncbi:hypothetical protein [Fluviicola chungangensis]|uniref:hypothetical protein n=1 Tax=Fluviicola chungangensis TaxID=2597671 RepID=UPI0016425C88|nr:hypothetical protein [Fluviicola chungangensis]
MMKKETIINMAHNPNAKKKRVKSKRGRAVKKVRKGRLKMSFEQNAIVKIPKTKGIIFKAKNSFLVNRFPGPEKEVRVRPAGDLAEIKIPIKDPPIK